MLLQFFYPGKFCPVLTIALVSRLSLCGIQVVSSTGSYESGNFNIGILSPIIDDFFGGASLLNFFHTFCANAPH
jgi:hypothetical protein